jgi:hypothetical protein
MMSYVKTNSGLNLWRIFITDLLKNEDRWPMTSYQMFYFTSECVHMSPHVVKEHTEIHCSSF